MKPRWWAKAKARFPKEAELRYTFDGVELGKARWAWVADKRLADIQALTRGSGASRRLLRRVRRDLLLFKNQCWFSQITNRERGLVLWKKWQKVFETRTLLREVNEQSEELNNYLQARYRERMEWLVRIGSFLAAAIPMRRLEDELFDLPCTRARRETPPKLPRLSRRDLQRE